jgi:predicted dehydrogenase
MIGVAIVGMGSRGMRVVELLRRQSQLRVVCGVEPDRQRRAAVVASESFPVGDQLEVALSDPAVHAVILTTPHSGHEDQVAQAARAGTHVFCEKPLGMTRESALRSVEACTRAKVVLGLGHERRFEPPMLELRRMIARGDLGTLLQVEANFSHDELVGSDKESWWRSPREAPAAGMTGPGIHLLDLCVSMLGEADRVVAHSATLATEMPAGDAIAALIRFRSGATAYVSAMLATPFVSRFQVFGSRGWAEIRGRGPGDARHGWAMTIRPAGGRPRVRRYPSADAALTNLQAFANAVEGLVPYPIRQVEMINSVAVMEAIFISTARGGAVVEV